MNLSCSLIWEGPIENCSFNSYVFGKKEYLQQHVRSFQSMLQKWGSSIQLDDPNVDNEYYINFDAEYFNYEQVEYLFTFQRIPESLCEYPTSFFSGSMELKIPSLNILMKICSLEGFLKSKALKIFDNGVVITIEDVAQCQAEFERLASIPQYTFETRSEWQEEFIEKVYDEEDFKQLEQAVLEGSLSQEDFDQQILNFLKNSCCIFTN